MAAAVTDVVTYLAKGGTDTAGPVLIQLIRQIGQRFGVVASEKAVAQLIPIIGAASGAAIATLFIDHFQDMACGHFTVRHLERKYGAAMIQAEYEKLTQLGKSIEPQLELSGSASA
ncbi:peptidase [Caballeronia telluris]|uniref:Peptidase n=2 Tax=Caballeronia telluris TaxID=326475 RepID=A0A158FI50_9BURK|nr:peptidase [Caballeronia telluris]